METLNRTMSAQTEKLIKGLERLIDSKNAIYDSLTYAYGEDRGEEIFRKSYEPYFELLVTTLKMEIGTSMEFKMQDLRNNEF